MVIQGGRITMGSRVRIRPDREHLYNSHGVHYLVETMFSRGFPSNGVAALRDSEGQDFVALLDDTTGLRVNAPATWLQKVDRPPGRLEDDMSKRIDELLAQNAALEDQKDALEKRLGMYMRDTGALNDRLAEVEKQNADLEKRIGGHLRNGQVLNGRLVEVERQNVDLVEGVRDAAAVLRKLLGQE
jgi:hypothetical protein